MRTPAWPGKGGPESQPPATLPELKADEAKKDKSTEYRRWHLRLKRAEETPKPKPPGASRGV